MILAYDNFKANLALIAIVTFFIKNIDVNQTCITVLPDILTGCRVCNPVYA